MMKVSGKWLGDAPSGEITDDGMLLGIIADLHANLEASEAVLRQLDAMRPDRVICLGDVTGYYANPNEVVALVRERNIDILMGNHDSAVCGLEEPWFFNENAQAAIRWQSDQLLPEHREWLAGLPPQLHVDSDILAVHGAPGNRDDYIVDWLDAMRHVEYLARMNVKICFFGHSHRATMLSERGSTLRKNGSGAFEVSPANRYFINPGSVGQPRDRDPRAAFGLYDTDARTFEFHRVEYDIHAAARKVVDAGLPVQLGRRLLEGR